MRSTRRCSHLVYYRLTLDMKCGGLDAEQLARRSVPPSTLSLLGLVRHLAQMENHWFQRVLQGRTDRPRLFKRDDDRDAELNGAIAGHTDLLRECVDGRTGQ